MRYTVPIEDLLLLLRTYAVVLVEKVKKWTLWVLQRGITAGFEVSEVRENAFFKFLGVLDRAAKSLEAKCKATHNVGSGDVE